MKRCPECRRDYYDDSLLYCLDDGSALLEGPASGNEPATAILHETAPPGEAATRAQILTTETTGGAGPKAAEIHKPDSRKRTVAVSFLVFALIAGLFAAYRYVLPSADRQINSIAVLPFSNVSGNKETEFLGDGISETLINNFTKIPDLKVTARSTAFSFRGREGEPKEIGRQLGVGSVLTGSLFQRGDNVSIQVDLVNTGDGHQIWGNRYEGKASDIVNIQQRIATDVSTQLKLKLNVAQAQQIAKTYTQNPEAYEHYLRGRYYWNKRTADDLKRGLQEFQAAAELDPDYALAYVGLADTYAILEEYTGAAASDVIPKARAFAQKALQIDDSLGEANATIGLMDNHDWKWEEAEAEFARAIALNPNYPTVHHWHSINLRDTGRVDEALIAIKRAQELDPLSKIINVNVGIIYLNKGDSDAATKQLNATIDLDPNWWAGHMWLGVVYLRLGRNQDAIVELQKSVDLSNRASWPLSFIGYAYAISGKRSEAEAIAKELEDRYPRREAVAVQVSGVLAGLGEKDGALMWLEKGAADHSGELQRITWYPPFDSLRDGERYTAVVRLMGL